MQGKIPRKKQIGIGGSSDYFGRCGKEGEGERERERGGREGAGKRESESKGG